MEVFSDQAPGPQGGVVTMGTFDGVHRGHLALLKRAREEALRLNAFIEVWVYHPHPREVLRGEAVPLLTLLPERLELLAQQGVGAVRVITFDAGFATLSAEAFVAGWIEKLCAPQMVVLGYDHHFGRGRAGDANFLRNRGLSVVEVPPLIEEGVPISSSRIRHLISAGEMEAATRLLGYAYYVEGEVQRGRRVARQLGTPTLNLPWPSPKVRPPSGVYAGRVYLRAEREVAFSALLYLSPEGLLEAHCLEGEVGELYGAKVRVEIAHFIRPHAEGLSEEELRTQIQKDLACVRAYWGLPG